MKCRSLSGQVRSSSIICIPSSVRIRHYYHLFTNWKLWTCIAFVCGVLAAIPANGLPFELPKITCLALGALLGIGGMIAEQRHCIARLGQSKIGKACLLFFLIVALSPAWSIAPLQSIIGASPRFEGVLCYVLSFCWLLIGMQMASDARGRQYIEYALLSAAGGVVLYGIVQILHIDPLASLWQSDVFLGRIFSTLGQPTALGLWLLLVVPIVCQHMMESTGARRIMTIGLMMGICILLLATVSRAAFFGLIAMIILGAWWHRGRIRKFGWPQWVAVMTAVILVLSLGSCFAQIRFSTDGEDTRSQSSRLLLWNTAVHMTALRPYGYGLDTMGLVSGSFIPQAILRYEPLTVRIDRAHSQILDLALSFGVGGTFIFYLFLLSLIVAAVDAKPSAKFAYARPYALALAGSSLCLLFVFHTVTTAVTFFFIAGVVLGTLLPAYRRAHSLSDAIGLRILFVTLGIMTIGSLCWMRSDILMTRANSALTKNDLSSALSFSIQSVAAFPFDRLHLIDALELQLNLQSAAQQNTVFAQAVETNIQRELIALHKLTGGRDGLTYLLAAWHTALQDNEVFTEKYLAMASVHSPGRVTYLRIAAHCFELLGDRKKTLRAQALLIDLLPPDWKNPTSVSTRILHKENPWLKELNNYHE